MSSVLRGTSAFNMDRVLALYEALRPMLLWLVSSTLGAAWGALVCLQFFQSLRGFPDKKKAMEKIRDLTLLSDIFPTGYHGAVNAGVVPGSTVYVAGAGPVGWLAPPLASCWVHLSSSLGTATSFAWIRQRHSVARLSMSGTATTSRNKSMP
jgi:hypothetical protein